MINIKAEINEISNRKTIEKINEAKAGSCKKMNKIGKPLARLIKREDKNHQYQERNGRILQSYSH